ncbi:hypothetical protein IJH02_03200 [Candidatus Saccharibacteria bacterium]|nr:hypothetical protein [Candidatus Saccharibacteria bacterium]
MDVFSAFPNALVSNVWEIGEMTRDTEIGKSFADPAPLDVIIDDEEQAFLDTSPQAEYRDSYTLVFAKPEQLPTLNTSKLQGGYLLRNTETCEYFEIRKCSIGKNQETGQIEHVEFELHQTEVDNEL